MYAEVVNFKLSTPEPLANIKNTIILFVCPSKIIHLFLFSWDLKWSQEKLETFKGNAKFWRDKQRVLWYFDSGLLSVAPRSQWLKNNNNHFVINESDKKSDVSTFPRSFSILRAEPLLNSLFLY